MIVVSCYGSSVNLTDQLGYEMIALLFDAPAPLSVVFPEARLFLPQTRTVGIEDALDWLVAASQKGWLALSVDDGIQAWPYRSAAPNDLMQIADEYRTGLRNANEVRQILDRVDLWLEISAEGKAAVREAWPHMPGNA